MMLVIICANHVYGHPLTFCESFTSGGPQWEETPFGMKPIADQAFCDGLNRVRIAPWRLPDGPNLPVPVFLLRHPKKERVVCSYFLHVIIRALDGCEGRIFTNFKLADAQ